MSTETAVHLKIFGDQLGLIAGLMVNALGPAIVKLAEWMLWAVSHKGFMRDVLEGADFKLREAAGKSGLPGYTTSTGWNLSAAQRAESAAMALTIVSEYEFDAKTGKGRPFSEVADRLNLGQSDSPLEDFKGSSYHDLSLYLQGLINPVADVTNAATKGAGEDMDKLQKIIEGFQAQIDAEIARLKKPKDPGFIPNPAGEDKPKKEKFFHEKGDALLRVGNFLGSSKSALESIGEKQLQVLQQIARNTTPQSSFLGDVNISDADFGMV